MRKLRHLHSIMACLFFGCLFVTMPFSFSMAYESSIQTSKFLAEDPAYEAQLFEGMEHRRAAFLWNMALEGERYDTAQNTNAQIVTFGMNAKFRYRLIDNLKIKAKARVQFQNGRAQDVFGDVEPDSGVYMREAVLNYTPESEWVSLDAGIVSQAWLANPLFITGRGLPGARETLKYSTDDLELRLTAQQLVPTSTTLSTRVAEKEGTPTFYTYTLGGYYGLSDWNWIRGSVTAFQYNDLPSVVAFDSQKWGNTFVGGNINNAEFAYEFKGWMSQLTFEQKITHKFSAQIQVNAIKNTEAPDSDGESQSLVLSTSYDMGRWLLQPRYETYFVEPDAVPAYYNDWIRGHNNRIGQVFTLGLESKDWNLRFKADYVNANLLQDNGIVSNQIQQDDLELILLSVETSYDSI